MLQDRSVAKCPLYAQHVSLYAPLEHLENLKDLVKRVSCQLSVTVSDCDI